MAVLEVVLILLVGGAGIWYAGRHLRRNWREMRAARAGKATGPDGAAKPVSTSDLVFNYGLSFLWFGYLFAFFAGLVVNNLLR